MASVQKASDDRPQYDQGGNSVAQTPSGEQSNAWMPAWVQEARPTLNPNPHPGSEDESDDDASATASDDDDPPLIDIYYITKPEGMAVVDGEKFYETEEDGTYKTTGDMIKPIDERLKTLLTCKVCADRGRDCSSFETVSNPKNGIAKAKKDHVKKCHPCKEPQPRPGG